MTDYLDHPNEEALERFLRNEVQESELETIETHILACESCVTRLEALEIELAAAKAACQELEAERIRKQAAPARSWAARSWKDWFTLPALSWAGAAAVLALGITVVPQFMPRDVNLTASRGLETSGMTLSPCGTLEAAVVPGGRPLDLHLKADDLPEGRVNLEIVNGLGKRVWQGAGLIHQQKADVVVPRITTAGAYFLRVYTPAQPGSVPDVLREFRFEVR
jgi:hypothetical protein